MDADRGECAFGVPIANVDLQQVFFSAIRQCRYFRDFLSSVHMPKVFPCAHPKIALICAWKENFEWEGEHAIHARDLDDV